MGLGKEDLPVSENLADVLARVLPVWESEVCSITPQLAK